MLVSSVFLLVLTVLAAFVGRVLFSFYSRKSKSPTRPLLTCFCDACCEIFVFLKVGSWAGPPDIHAAMKQAMKETGLSDWGNKSHYGFIQRYNTVRTVGLAKSKVKFSPIGHWYTLVSLTRRMKTRLLLFDYLKMHPQIQKIKLKSPVFVIGFPRTGTTFLHEMLGLHEGVRMHYTWEQFEPIPVTHDESIEAQTKDRKKRYEKNKGFFDMLMKYFIGPRIQDMHRIAYD